jgi:hypothetical protein
MKILTILQWIIKIISVILLFPVLIIAIPGGILFFISEELEDYIYLKWIKKDTNFLIKKHDF